MTEFAEFLFKDHWLAGSLILPWVAAVWDAMHGQWARLIGVLLYLELIGGPLVLLK